MWSNKQTPDDDSWEVRAFEEDTTGNILGCTWPPRSYTCTFCRREFRSAQALGGHMNVHRRDRARLHELPPPVLHSPAAASTQVLPSAAVFIPTSGQEFVVGNGNGNGNGNGLCLVYPLLNPNSNSTILIPSPTALDTIPSHPPLLPISHFFKCEPNHDTAANSVVSSLCHSSNTDAISPSNSNGNCNDLIIKDENAVVKDNAAAAAIEEELDLELRLGRRTPPPGDD